MDTCPTHGVEGTIFLSLFCFSQEEFEAQERIKEAKESYLEEEGDWNQVHRKYIQQ